MYVLITQTSLSSLTSHNYPPLITIQVYHTDALIYKFRMIIYSFSFTKNILDVAKYVFAVGWDKSDNVTGVL